MASRRVSPGTIALCVHAYVASVVNGDLILVLCSSLWTLSWLMNAEQRGGMALNKDFRSKTGNGSVSREGRAIATPTGELHPQHPSLHLSLFISPSLFFYFPLSVKSACSLSFSSFFHCFIPICHSLSLPLSLFSVFFFHSAHLFNLLSGFDFHPVTWFQLL